MHLWHLPISELCKAYVVLTLIGSFCTVLAEKQQRLGKKLNTSNSVTHTDFIKQKENFIFGL